MSATATISRPLTEEQIGEAIAHSMREGKLGGMTGDGLSSELLNLIRDVASPLTNPVFLALEFGEQEVSGATPDDGDLWFDLRTSEATRLRAVVSMAVVQAADRCEQIIREELTAAGVKFAKEFPEAPRPA